MNNNLWKGDETHGCWLWKINDVVFLMTDALTFSAFRGI